MATARKTIRRPYGAGSLYARGGVWYAHWRADGGRQVKRRVGPMRVEGSRDGLTRSQAEAELRRLIAETKPARMTSGEVLTMAELGRRHLANLERQSRKKATTTAVESILRVWLEPFFAERDLRRITAQDVQDLMMMMEKGERPGPQAKGDRRYGRPVGAKSVRNHIGYLSALLGFAERKGWLPVNVARHVELPGKPESAEIRFIEPLEVRALADAAVDGPYREIDRAMYLTAAMTGLRQGELVALRWRQRTRSERAPRAHLRRPGEAVSRRFVWPSERCDARRRAQPDDVGEHTALRATLLAGDGHAYRRSRSPAALCGKGAGSPRRRAGVEVWAQDEGATQARDRGVYVPAQPRTDQSGRIPLPVLSDGRVRGGARAARRTRGAATAEPR